MRLTDPRPPAPAVTLFFQGRPVAARAGETVAAALAAAGHAAFRTTPGGAPRGLWCGMGACFDCIVTIDGQPSQRACMTKVSDGMRIEPTPAPAAGPAPAPETVLTPAVLVIGGGPAGLSAALAAARAGVGAVLLDERDAPGGQYYKPAARPDPQGRRGDRLRAAAQAAGVKTIGAAVWGAFSRADGPEIAAAAPGARLVLRPGRLVLATGAYETPVHLPGWTLPGCMTTGAMQSLMRSHRVSPGGRVVIAGNGPLNLQLAVELVRGGGTVAAVVDAAAHPAKAGLAMAWASPALAQSGLRMLAALRRAGGAGAVEYPAGRGRGAGPGHGAARPGAGRRTGHRRGRLRAELGLPAGNRAGAGVGGWTPDDGWPA